MEEDEPKEMEGKAQPKKTKKALRTQPGRIGVRLAHPQGSAHLAGVQTATWQPRRLPNGSSYVPWPLTQAAKASTYTQAQPCKSKNNSNSLNRINQNYWAKQTSSTQVRVYQHKKSKHHKFYMVRS